MKKVLYVVENDKSFQFRYRVKNLIDILGNSKNWSVKYVSKSDLAGFSLKDYSLVVVERQTARDSLVLELIRRLKRAGIKVLFDIDDLVFDYGDLGLVYNTVKEKNLLYWMGYFWGIRRIAKRVDGFLCTNEFLGRKLKRSFNKPYKVIPNSLNKKQVEYSNELVKNKTEKENFIIGYFSGSPTHAKDFEMVEQELIRFLNTHDAKLKVVGYMNFSDEMNTLIKQNKVQFSKPVNYLKLQELMAEVDVNIAPLVINDFTNCKSELKFFEAAIVETTTIASPTYTFKNAITDGKNGFLAQPGEWQDKLEYLYKNPEVNKKIAKAAKEYALKHYYGKEFLEEVEKAYDFFAK